MFDDGHAFCFSCRYYEKSVDIIDASVYDIGVEGEEATSESPPDLPWSGDSHVHHDSDGTPQKTQDDMAGTGADDSSSTSHPRSSRKQEEAITYGFIEYYRDKYKNI